MKRQVWTARAGLFKLPKPSTSGVSWSPHSCHNCMRKGFLPRFNRTRTWAHVQLSPCSTPIFLITSTPCCPPSGLFHWAVILSLLASDAPGKICACVCVGQLFLPVTKQLKYHLIKRKGFGVTVLEVSVHGQVAQLVLGQ